MKTLTEQAGTSTTIVPALANRTMANPTAARLSFMAANWERFSSRFAYLSVKKDGGQGWREIEFQRTKNVMERKAGEVGGTRNQDIHTPEMQVVPLLAMPQQSFCT
jgi:hypothetical protein